MIIQTVYKPEENIDYIEEWLDHHLSIGIEHFYMYDNSGGIEQRLIDENLRDLEYLRTKNKHGLEYKIDPREAHARQTELFKKYPVTWIKWQRRNKNNIVLYDQVGAMTHFVQHVKTGLCAFIDIDEFIIKREEFKESRLQQHKYKSRAFYNSVYECHERVPLAYTENWNPKAIIDLSKFPSKFEDIHFREFDLPETLNFFNHYNHNEMSHTAFDHTNPNIPSKFSALPYETVFEYVEDTGLGNRAL